MLRFIYVLLFLVFVVEHNVVIGQSEIWTLETCIERALASNITIEMERNNVLHEQYSKKQGFADLFPSLNSNHRVGYDYGRSIDENNNITFDPKYSASHSLNSSVVLFKGFSKINFYRASSYFYKASENYYDFVKKQVELDVTRAWYNLLLQKELTKVEAERVSTSKKQLEYIATLVETGKKEQAAILDAEASLAFAEVEFRRAKNREQNTAMELQQMLELDYSTQFHIQSMDAMDQLPKDITLKVDSLYNDACSNFERIKQLELELQAHKFNLKAQKGNYSPTLSANASLSTAYFKNTAVENTPAYLTQIDNKLNTYIGLNLSIPIFNGLSQNYSVKRSALVYDNAILRLEKEQRGVRKDLEAAVLGLQAAYSEYAASVSHLNYAESAYETMKERYNLGIANITDLMLSEDRYLESKATLLSNKYKWIVQKKLIEYYVGG